MNKPVIGISTSTIVDGGGMFPGYHRTYVNEDYINSVISGGGIPMMIPLSNNEEVLKAQLSLCDGLIISGGHDVYPLNYGQEPRQALGDVYPERDTYEYTLLELAEAQNIPVMGICRGLQIINTFYGGTLHQDLHYVKSETHVLKHNQAQRPDLRSHSVKTVKGSKLQTLIGEETMVNSFHHQVIDQVAKGFTTVASAPDGCVEAIEKDGDRYVIGIQWHPEMLAATTKEMLNVFEELVKASSK